MTSSVAHGQLLALCPSGPRARCIDMESDCASAIALHVEEQLVHGVDIARATGATWPVSRREALVAIAGRFQVMPKLVDAEATRGRRIVFEIRGARRADDRRDLR